MKRTATTLVLLAGFSGGCTSTDANKEQIGGYGTVTRGRQIPGVMGPTGEPVMQARGAMPGGPTSGGVMPAGGAVANASRIQQAALFHKKADDCGESCAHVPGISGGHFGRHFAGHGGFVGGHGGGHGGAGMGGPTGGIFPVPGMGPPGAVAAVGALVPGRGGAAGMMAGRTSVKFTGPAGMKVTWQLPTGDFNPEASGLTARQEYNFLQGQVYRLRLTQVLPNHPGKSFYPTLEISPANPKTLTFLAHASVPLTFTNEDFDQAVAGNLVVKVIYLPDRENQDFVTVAGAEELVSTRLEPGADPVAEAQRRGTILLIVRLGNIDLENRFSPAMTAPPPGGGIPGLPPGAMVVPPGMVPPGMLTPGGPGVPPKPVTPGPGAGMPPGVSTIPGPGAPAIPGPITPPKAPTSSGTPTLLPAIR
jgi:hypothetical protein